MVLKRAFQNPKRRKKLIWIGTVLFVYTIVGFFVLPAIIKSQMLKRLPALTKRNVTVEKVKLNPYAFSLTIRGLKLTEGSSATKTIVKTSGKLTADEMEQMLVDNSEISDLELRELMQERAQKVQSLLLKTEKIAPERLFLLAPKPVTKTVKGESRVNFSLN